MNINRRNIIQFKPEGPANIFAPIIRINGGALHYEPNPSPANSFEFGSATYPQTATVSRDRANLVYETEKTDNFNTLMHSMFTDILQDTPDSSSRTFGPSYTDQTSTYGISQDSSQHDYAKFLSSSLQSHVNCMNKKGNCTPKSECPTGKSMGDCFLKDQVCCKDDTPPQANSFGTESQHGTSDSYSNSVTSNSITSNSVTSNSVTSNSVTSRPSVEETDNYVDIKYTGILLNSISYEEKEELKKNALDKYLVLTKKHGITKDDIKEVKLFSGSIYVRIILKNKVELSPKIKKGNDTIRRDLVKLNIYVGRERIYAANVTSPADYIPDARTNTGVSTQADPSRLPSEMGTNKTFCQTYCGRVLNESTNLYKWKECTPPCRDNKCYNCVDTPNYINPNDDEKLIAKNFIEAPKKKVTLYNDWKKPTAPLRPDTNNCYDKGEGVCNTDPNCFFCLSDEIKNKKKCTILPNGKYICDERNVSACVPLYNDSNGNLKPYTEGPLHEANFAKYKSYSEDFEIDGKIVAKNVIDYPYQGKCLPPIKREIKQNSDEARFIMEQRYHSKYR